MAADALPADLALRGGRLDTGPALAVADLPAGLADPRAGSGERS